VRRAVAALAALLALPACAGAAPAPLVPSPPSSASAVETVESMLGERMHLTTRTVLYRVTGDAIPDVRDTMKRIGPIDDGGHQFAFTWINFAWRYPFARGDDGCRTGPVSIEIEIVTTLPEWTAPKGASEASVREWRRWLDATRSHEDGHRAIGLDTARTLAERLGAVGALPTCEDVDHAASAAGAEAIDAMRARHREYDRTTRHGATQGAVLHDE